MMRRWIAGGVAVGWATLAVAADPKPMPVSVNPPAAPLPGTMVPAPAGDVTKPLSSVLDAAPAGIPTVPPHPQAVPTPAYIPAELCGPAESSRWGLPRLGVGSCGCLDKLKAYFGWKAGPRVAPAFTPTPYHPPLRHYFPAGGAVKPGCGPAVGQAGWTYPTPVAGPAVVGGVVTAGSPVESAASAPFFNIRLVNRPDAVEGCADGGCANGNCRGRCDGCHETVLQKAIAAVTPRQFGRLQPNCWMSPRAPGVSACAAGGCGHGPAVGPGPAGGVVYPGHGGGYHFASPVYVPHAPPVTASIAAGSGVGGTGTTAAVGGNVGAVGTGSPGTGAGDGK